ncbi:MAG: hemolysin family protein, partial [Flavobacteriales bacterium]|nr:hemolysin family protein [Flavobacteriales bacterium]
MSTTIAILVCLVLSAFFSGMEIAFISANRFKLEVERKKGSTSANIVSGFLDHPSRFISTMLVGNNIALVVYGILMASVLEPLLSPITKSGMLILLMQTIIATLIVLVTAEFLPKAFFRINPNKMLMLFAIPGKVVTTLLNPIVWVIDRFSNKLLSALFKMRVNEEKISFGRGDLDQYVNEFSVNGTEEDHVENEVRIFRNALAFSELKVRECMVPRTEIEAMDISSDVEELRQRLIDTGYSKMLIYRDEIDNIIGYVHSFELFQRPKSIHSIIRPISLVPESTKAKDLLKQFAQQHRSVAVLLNEFGGTAGMITLEDIIEEIFGDFDDEHDTDDLLEEQLGE